MPKAPTMYATNYRKRAARGSKSGPLGTGVPPVTSDANEIAFSNQKTSYPKTSGGKNSRPNSKK